MSELDMTGIMIPQTDESVALALTKMGDYLAYIQLFAISATAVGEGKIAAGNWGIVQNQTIIDLGKEFSAHVIMWRPKAMVIADQIISYFNVNSPEFIKTKEQSEIKDTGCMAGLEFLLYLPEHDMFVTFFAANKSARKESGNIRTFCGGKFTTWKSVFHKGQKYNWYVPQVIANSTPASAQPDPVTLKEQVDKFANPTSSQVEKVDPKAASDRAR